MRYRAAPLAIGYRLRPCMAALLAVVVAGCADGREPGVSGEAVAEWPADGGLAGGPTPLAMARTECVTAFRPSEATELGCEVVRDERRLLETGEDVLVVRYRRWVRDEVRTWEDSTQVDEIVLFRVEGDAATPIWHRVGRDNFLGQAVWGSYGGVDLLQVLNCVRGTGGCVEEILMWRGREWRVAELAYQAELEAHVPTGYALHKGRRIDPTTLEFEQPVARPGDPNCCPSASLVGRLTLDGWRLRLASSPELRPAPSAVMTPQVGSRLERHLAGSGFSGAALVVRSGVVALRAGFGLADVGRDVSNSPELIYPVGSLTKPVTASAILHAVSRGHLDLGDSVCRHVRGCPPEWAPVEVRHLLDHTSGIPDLFGALPEAPLLQTTAEVDRLLSARPSIPLRSQPGAEYSYSNFNYVLLGYLLRSATGVDWETYLRANVLEPVGAVDTRYYDVWAAVPRRARGHERVDGGIREIETDDHSAYAAGGLESTVDDLRRWHEGLHRGDFFPRALLGAALDPNQGGYGQGWQIVRALGRELQNHTGGIGGFSSHLAWYPAEQLLVVLLSNVEGSDVKALACDLARLVLDVPPVPTTEPEWLAATSAERCGQEPLEPLR